MSLIELLIKTGYTLLGLKYGPDQAPPFNKQSVKKILVVRNDNLGDLLLTIPALRALRESFPKAYLAVLVNGYTRPAIEGTPWIDKIHSYDKFKHGLHPTRFHAWLQQYCLIKELQAENFDLAIGVRAGFSTSNAHLVYATAARWRLGPKPKRNKANFAFFLNISPPEINQDKHEVERSLDIVRTIGVDTTNKKLEFFIPPQHPRQTNEWLVRNKLRQPLLGIQLSQRLEENRSWSTDKYVNLINSLREKGEYTPVLIYAPSDAAAARRIQQTLRKKISSFSSPDLKAVASLINSCEIFITLESGAMHLAAAVGTPTIAVFGKTNQNIWRPWLKNHITLKQGNQENAVSVDDVLRAVKRLSSNSG